jgi:hypothetical protein
MAVEQLQVAVGICDACGTLRHGGPNGEPPEGHRGTVAISEQDYADWFSCSVAPGHIGKAVRAAIKAESATLDKARAT